MANEFIARNGLVSLKDSTISGSLTVTGTIAGTISGSVSNAVSASYALTASYAMNGGGGGGAAFPFSGSAVITGSLTTTDNIGIGISSPTASLDIVKTISFPSGSTSPKILNASYIINNSGAVNGTVTGLFLSVTETSLNGMNHNFIDLQRNGISIIKFVNSGQILVSQLTFLSSGTYLGSITAMSDGVFRLNDAGGGSFNRLQLGGTTPSFPSIARSNNNIIICSADASAGAGLGVGMASATGIMASAILQADSITQGFLPPRQTTTQINAIVSPAEGLVVFNTTISHLCVYQAGVWVKINHSPM